MTVRCKQVNKNGKVIEKRKKKKKKKKIEKKKWKNNLKFEQWETMLREILVLLIMLE